MMESEQNIDPRIKKIIPKEFWFIETDRTAAFKKLYKKASFIHGLVGRGKSILAASLAKKYILEGKEVKWENFANLMREIRFRISLLNVGEPIDEHPEEIIKRLGLYKGILIIDEFGGIRDITEYQKDLTYQIINYRKQNRLVTIMTSYYSSQQISDRIHPAIASRILGMCEVIELTGPDRRKSGKPYMLSDIGKVEEVEKKVYERTPELQKKIDDMYKKINPNKYR